MPPTSIQAQQLALLAAAPALRRLAFSCNFLRKFAASTATGRKERARMEVIRAVPDRTTASARQGFKHWFLSLLQELQELLPGCAVEEY